MDQGNGLFQVAIDFPTSHTFFPHIIQWVILGLVVLIAIVHGREIAHNARSHFGQPREARAGFDMLRVFGTLVLVVAYFFLMQRVGDMFPNEGYGFLFVSMPFMFLLSMLYAHEVTRRKIILAAVVSIAAPLIAWYVLGRLFWITLP